MIRKERRIPTILGLLIIFLGIGGTAFLVENFQTVRTLAQPSIVPKELVVTNLGPHGFTLSWLTEKETAGFIVFGEEKKLKETAFDERDKEGSFGKYLTHHVSLKNLKPNTSYYFKIISEGKSFDQGGFPYEAKTTPFLPPSSSSLEPAYGTVLNPDNSPCQGAIVYLTLKGSPPLSSLTRESGNFLIPLNWALRSDLKGYLASEGPYQEEVIVRAGVGKLAKALTDTENDSPLPTMILGKSYDFRKERVKKKEILVEKKLPQKILGAETSPKVEILFPKEGMVLLDERPLFKGRGIPLTKVEIKIETPILLEKVIVDPNGQWFFRPKKPLLPGRHKIILTAKDEKGEMITLSRSFFILKSGTQVLGEATPSATLTPTPSPTFPTATPTPSVLTPTPTPSLTPGVFLPTTLLLGLGSLLLLLGTAFVFK